jgi:dolichyl-phosphate-mannose-protein mannosyltransferase
LRRCRCAVALYELGLAGAIHRWFDPAFDDSPALTAATKIPGLCFGIGLAVLLWWAVRRRTGSEESAAWAALAWWANPATILNAEVLGYLDPLMSLPVIGAFVLVHPGLPAWAGASLAIAVLTKPQAILVAPVVALAAW